jgi:hypothetical protein
MKYRMKKNKAAEEAYIRDMDRCSSLQKVEQGEAEILRPSEYPEPLRRFLSRHRSMLHLRLSAATRKKLEQMSRATGLAVDELALRWVEQGIAREAS